MDVYEFSTTDIADGTIGLNPSRLQFTAADCLKIAQNARKVDRYKRWKEWLHEAEKLINDETNPQRHGFTTAAEVNSFFSQILYFTEPG